MEAPQKEDMQALINEALQPVVTGIANMQSDIATAKKDIARMRGNVDALSYIIKRILQ